MKYELPNLTGIYGDDVVRFSSGDEVVTIDIASGAVYGANGRMKPEEWTFYARGDTPQTRRDVWHYTHPQPGSLLRVGKTVHMAEGSWSSLPHDFEKRSESGFEELFFFVLEGTKRAWQVNRGKFHDGQDVDDICYLHDRTFTEVPMGYHPVVGEPGCIVSYYWAYLAKKPEWEKE